MIKQQQRVIRKGDYYQIQTYEQNIMLISKTKKQQPQNSQNSNVPLNEQILTEYPSWAQARGSYFRTQLINGFGNMGLEELVAELAIIGKEEGLRDEERNEIDMLSQEIIQFANSQQLQLNSLPVTKKSLQQAKNTPTTGSHTTITLSAQYDISKLSQRISQLQSLEFPDLLSLQHQLQIMLGDKKPLQSVELTQMDQKQKQQLNNLYNHLNSLSIINNTQRVIDSVFVNQSKHVEMQGWLNKMEQIQGLNGDFLMELKQDREIVERLESNFEQNVKHVKELLQELRGK